MDYITKVEICDKSKVYLRCMKKIPILIMLDNGRIGYKENVFIGNETAIRNWNTRAPILSAAEMEMLDAKD